MRETERVAVITPYCREAPETLRQCHESVLRQTHVCTHFMVADGMPSPEVSNWPVEHIILPRPHHDCGNTPRGLGALAAVSEGYDAIAFLDADNWYYPTHIETMVETHRSSGAAVCTASRMIHRLDGSHMYIDTNDSDGEKHVDTNCLFVTRRAFRVLPLWVMMPEQLAPIGDRVIWWAIKARRFSRAHHQQPTVAYRTQYKVHYVFFGETPPVETKSNAESTGPAFAWWNALSADERNEWLRQLV